MRGTTSKLIVTVIACVVIPLIGNYPWITAFHVDNWNFIGIPKPSSLVVGRSPTSTRKSGRLGDIAILGFVPTARILQSNQIAAFENRYLNAAI